jgi:uncharacterized metal-binding protein YceD (DUF177 family)
MAARVLRPQTPSAGALRVSLPIVPLDALSGPGLDVVVQGWASAEAAAALGGGVASLGGSLHVARVGSDIGVAGRVEAAANVACDRCGEPLVLRVASDVSCLYAAPRGVDEALPETSYDDVGDYDGVALDLAHVVGESLALERPARVLCSDVGASTDAACHARWRSAAGHPERAPDPRLAALRSLKISTKE